MTYAQPHENVLGFLSSLPPDCPIAVDIETTGLNPRKDLIIGLGIFASGIGHYIPTNIPNNTHILQVLNALVGKKLLAFNAAFDLTFLYNSYGIDLLPSLYCDVMLLKHACDENFPLDLKGIAKQVFGLDAAAEQEELKASIKANGGKAHEFYKADQAILAKYCIQDCALTLRLFDHYSPKLTANGLDAFFYTDETMPLYKEVVIPMERIGVHIDMPKLASAMESIAKDLDVLQAGILKQIEPTLDLFKSQKLDEEFPLLTPKGNKTKWQAKYATQQEAWDAKYPGESLFNLSSKHHLKALFFDILGLEPLSTTDKGSPQVDEEFLAATAKTLPWVQDLISFNKLSKISGTYLHRFATETENGMFYPRYTMHGTVSGRLSGDFQQLPRPLKGNGLVAKHTNVIRELVVPPAGQLLISADYNSLEPTIFAHVSGDKNLQDIFNQDRDFYSAVAIMTEGLTEYSSDKKAPNYLGTMMPELRQKAKAYALGLAYGMTDYKLQFEINTTQQQAAHLAQNYFNTFPQLKAWMDQSQMTAVTTGRVRTQTGRIRHLGQAVGLFQQYGMGLKDSLDLWKRFHDTPTAYKKAKEDRKVFTNLLNNAINFQVQGMGASVMNRACIALARTLKGKADIIGQIHDEVILQCPESQAPEVVQVIKEIMQSAVKLSVPLRTSPQVGKNFRECK